MCHSNLAAGLCVTVTQVPRRRTKAELSVKDKIMIMYQTKVSECQMYWIQHNDENTHSISLCSV